MCSVGYEMYDTTIERTCLKFIDQLICSGRFTARAVMPQYIVRPSVCNVRPSGTVITYVGIL